jgi:hypothetical protein
MDSTAGKMLIALNKTLADKLVIKFKTVHALAKHDWPFTDYVWQCSLDQSKGLAISTDYRSDKAAADFAHHIAEVERAAVAKEVNDARFASLIVDGATDSAIMEQDIIFVRTCESGQVKVRFLSIENTPKPDAVGVTASIKHGVESGLSIAFADFIPKFVAIATDGAAIMTGHKAGVVSNLKKDQPTV